MVFTVTKKHLRWELLLYGSAMNADSIEELKSSELVDFSPDYRRAGLLLPHDCFLFHNMVPRLERFMPTPVEITQANKAQAEIAASWTSVARLPWFAETHDRPTSPPVPNTQSIPEPEPLSGQKRGETWREYFSRMAKNLFPNLYLLLLRFMLYSLLYDRNSVDHNTIGMMLATRLDIVPWLRRLSSPDLGPV